VFVLDDLDGNLANGTPNCFAIAAAANAHSIPVPPGLGPCGQLPPPLSGVGLFRAPVFEPGLNSPFSDHSPALDATQKLAWFCSDRPGGVGGHDIWFSSRAAIAAPWAPPIDIANLNSPFDELYTWVSQDARTIWFSSNRPGGQGATDLWFSTRPAVPGVFAPPVPEVALNSPFLDEDPALSSDGLEIFFSSDRPGGFGPGAIWTAVRPAVGLPWGPPQLVLELDSLDYDHSPRLSSDGTRMIFASTRGLAGPGPSRFFLATRIQRGGLWTIRRELTEIATGGFDFNGDLTADGFSFWFSTRPLPGGPSDIRRADQLLPILGSISPVVRVGLSFLLILRRDPGNVGLIAFGTQISPIVLPPILGELELSPFVILTIGTHDANGIGTFLSPPIPPVLLGQQLHFQGVSGDAFGTYISNRFDLLVIP
jgi:hypothetical protein